MVRKVITLALVAFAFSSLGTTSAMADDHLVTAFQHASPNLGNSNPFCVPGAGDPKVGQDTGTPANSDGTVSCRQNGTAGTGKP